MSIEICITAGSRMFRVSGKYIAALLFSLFIAPGILGPVPFAFGVEAESVQSAKNTTEQRKAWLQSLISETPNLMQEVSLLHSQVEQFANERFLKLKALNPTLSNEEIESLFNAEINKNKIYIKSDLGESKLVLLDGNYVTRVVHNRSAISFIIMRSIEDESLAVAAYSKPEKELTVSSRALRAFVALQHRQSRNGRGRHTIVLRLEQTVDAPVSVDPFPVPADFIGKAKDWFFDVVKPIDKSDVAFGAGSALMAMSFVLSIEYIDSQWIDHRQISFASSAFTLAWYTVTGVGYSTYRNIILKGSWTKQFFFQTLDKVSFSLAAMLLQPGASNPFEHIQKLATNIIAGNSAKYEANSLPNIRTVLRENAGTMGDWMPWVKKIPYIGEALGAVSRSKFELGILAYATYFPLKMFGLLGPAAGNMIFAVYIPAAQQFVLRQSVRRYRASIDALLGADWNDLSEPEKRIYIDREEKSLEALKVAHQRWNFTKKLPIASTYWTFSKLNRVLRSFYTSRAKRVNEEDRKSVV